MLHARAAQGQPLRAVSVPNAGYASHLGDQYPREWDFEN